MNFRLPVTKSADYVRLSKRTCPQCGGPLLRVTRSFTDRLFSIFSSKHRYRCRNFSCRWEGALPTSAVNSVGQTGAPK